MNSRILSIAVIACVASSSYIAAEEITIGDKKYTAERVIERKLGPGTTYTRLRIPDYPLNVNLVTVDLNNPYNRIETTVANESAKGTESLVKAAQRLDAEKHHPLAAANANFWVVSSQKEYPLYSGITRNASVRNGKMVTECNNDKEKWDGGPERTGCVTISTDKVLNIDYCTPSVNCTYLKNDRVWPISTVNKGYRSGQYAIYNSFYGRDREFMPYYQDAENTSMKNQYTLKEDVTNAYELYFTLDEGQEWMGGKDLTFTCQEAKQNTNGRGKLGDYDLAVVTFGKTPKTKPGEKVVLNYSWEFQDGSNPIVEQAIGGNAICMRNGELTEHNYNEDYNSMVYSRTGYGCSADGKTLYIIVIDKSTDPVYGKSAGCPTSAMCEIARHFGCSNMSNFDAGGSAEMMVDYEIVNKTTDGTPRNVANGWMVFSIAPEDDRIASIEFDHPQIDLNAGASFTPTILGYNQYEALVIKDIKDFTLTCSPEIGSCNGNVFKAGTTPATGTLTATYGNLTVSKTVTVAGGSGIADIVYGNGNVELPSAALCGEELVISSAETCIHSAEIYAVSGMRMAYTQGNDNEIRIQAPNQTGIYLLNVTMTDGSRLGRKLFVK